MTYINVLVPEILGQSIDANTLVAAFPDLVIKNIQKKRAAICLKGAMSKKTGNLHTQKLFDEYNQEQNYCDFYSVYNCFFQHIIKPNCERYDIDIFLQSWNPELQNQLINLYKPVSYLFENNNLYANHFQNKLKEIGDYNGENSEKYAMASSSLAIKKSLELKTNYENQNNFKYDLVLIYRPDVILVRDINFDNYNIDGNVIYCNYTWINPHIPIEGQGEYYWIMSSETSNRFKFIYDASYKQKFVNHQGIYYFMKDVLKAEMRHDYIQHGYDITAARTETLGGFSIGLNDLKKYGFNFYIL
jgi:hypothetical protein